MSTIHRGVILLVAGLCLSPSPAGAATTVSLRVWAPGLWTAPVDAGPGQPMWHLLVDTGTTHTILSEAAARGAGLAVVPGGRLLTAAGAVEVGATRVPMLRIGSRTRLDVPVLVGDLSALGRDPRIDGILGMDGLDADRVVLDLVLSRLTLVDGPGDDVARRGTVLPARRLGGRVIVDARLDGARRGLVLDSGAAATVVFEGDDLGAVVDLRTAGGVTGGRERRSELAVGGLVIGPVRAVRIRPPAVATGAEGLLPAALFARIDIDRVAGVVRVQPRR